MVKPRPTQILVYRKYSSLYILDKTLTGFRSLYLYAANIWGVGTGEGERGEERQLKQQDRSWRPGVGPSKDHKLIL